MKEFGPYSCFLVLVRWLVWMSFPGFAAASKAAEPACSSLTNAEIYARANLEFPAAALFKPVEIGTNDIYFSLAPLLIQQDSNTVASAAKVFGALCFSNGVVSVNEAHPTLYHFADAVELNHVQHARLTYLWFYPVESRASTGAGFTWQGIRLTLSTNGQPVIWETLTDPSAKRVFYISQSLEAAAKEQYGPALPGRKYAIEPSAHELPGAVVARVIDDGPMPMGPIVYLQSDAKYIGTLICRCMPAQAKQLTVTRTYALRPFPTTESFLVRAQGQSANNRLAFWPGDEAVASSAANSLRLPKSF